MPRRSLYLWTPNLQREPQVGDIAMAKDIGIKTLPHNRHFIWASCPKCGLSRWVDNQYYAHHAKIKGQCRACTHSKTDEPRHYWTPALNRTPQSGEETKGKYITQPHSQAMADGIYVWTTCPKCACSRWVYKTNYLAISKGVCTKCAHSKTTAGAFWTPSSKQNPRIGDETRGQYIGKRRGQRRCIFIACPICKETRWIDKSYYDTSIPERKGLCHHCGNRLHSKDPIKYHKTLRTGYVLIKLSKTDPFYCMANHGGYCFEHRLVVARSLGRPLTKKEVVHHKNGIKNDNRLENLELTPSNKAHGSLTAQCMHCELRKEIRLLKWQVKQQNTTIQELKDSLQYKLGGKYDQA